MAVFWDFPELYKRCWNDFLPGIDLKKIFSLIAINPIPKSDEKISKMTKTESRFVFSVQR
jgi:hypothetical protein